ncbi:hypothetical protein TeGR_g3234 [Tetraparma gracilis]|uniref:START domain-containing protein n=1 Tax=Tetraparma gracilis TaxID=2962635 RepID=A0ABQ6MXA1_9STRA|nr:hypothetical protein TeGR_g3234 [Tetraparma gracilis]
MAWGMRGLLPFFLLLLLLPASPRRRGFSPRPVRADRTQRPWSPDLISLGSRGEGGPLAPLAPLAHDLLQRSPLPPSRQRLASPTSLDLAGYLSRSRRSVLLRAGRNLVYLETAVAAAAFQAQASLRAPRRPLPRRAAAAPAAPNLPGSGLSGEEVEALLRELEELLEAVTVNTFDNDPIWEPVRSPESPEGVSVWRTSRDVMDSSGRPVPANTPPVIRARRLLSVSPDRAMSLFLDQSRVPEYNPNARELRDLFSVDASTTVNRCASVSYGPFKPRDFVTVVRNRPLPGGGHASVAVPFEASGCPAREGYVRSSIRLSATFFLPVPGRPGSTEMVVCTQLGDLGGVADTKVARRLQERLVSQAPVDFLDKFSRAALRTV